MSYEEFREAYDEPIFDPSTLPMPLDDPFPVNLKIVNISNPHCWYRGMVGETISAVWFPIWGCYLVEERKHLHPDDCILRMKDVEIVVDRY